MLLDIFSAKRVPRSYDRGPLIPASTTELCSYGVHMSLALERCNAQVYFMPQDSFLTFMTNSTAALRAMGRLALRHALAKHIVNWGTLAPSRQHTRYQTRLFTGTARCTSQGSKAETFGDGPGARAIYK